MTENLKIWQALEKTDPKYTKAFDKGTFKGTAINPTYQIRKITEQFGPVGTGWTYRVKDTHIVPSPETGETMVYVIVACAVLGGPQAEFDGVGGDFIVRKSKSGFRADDDAFKKATTDAVCNAFKFLGTCADVYLGRYDDNKYVEELKEEMAPKEITLEEKQFQRDVSYAIELCRTPEEIDELLGQYAELPGNLTDGAALRKKGLEAKTKFKPPEYGFVNVAEALEWGKNARQTIDGSKMDYLEVWMQDNDHKIKALDKMLKAAIYNKDGSPSERLFKRYEERVNEG